MGRCRICGLNSRLISDRLGLCLRCIRERPNDALQESLKVHAESRSQFGLPSVPPRDPDGIACGICMNKCLIGLGKRGFCGLVSNIDGRLTRFGGTPEKGILEWYYDPLPTNCVAWWFCAGCTGLGYPKYAYKAGAETGYSNLAVFYGACLPEHEKLFAIIDDKPTIIDIGKLVTGILKADSADKLSLDPFILSKPRASIKVAGLDDNCEIKFAPVSKVSRRWFDGQLLKINLETGRTLHVTPDHPMLVLQQNKFAVVNADQLNIGDHVPVAKRLSNPIQNVDELDLIAELKKGVSHNVMAHFSKSYGQEISIPRLKGKRACLTNFLTSLIENDVHPIKVKRIDSIPYKGYVYDLEVNDPSAPLATFMLASGVFTHNCSFDCLFCQNWHYRALSSKLQPVISAESLAAKVHNTVSCLSGRTRVFLSNGRSVSLEDLFKEMTNAEEMVAVDGKLGVKVNGNVKAISINHELRSKEVPIEYIWRSPGKGKSMIELTTTHDLTIKLTEDHLIPVWRNTTIKWTPASEVEKGDYIVVAREVPVFDPLIPYMLDLLDEELYADLSDQIWKDIFIKAKKSYRSVKSACKRLGIPYRTYTGYVNRRRKILKIKRLKKLIEALNLDKETIYSEVIDVFAGRKRKPIKVPLKVTHEILEMAGMILSDGHLTPIRIDITNSESAFISAFKKLARRNFGANIQYYPRKNALPLYVLYSKAITSIFHSLGIPYGDKSTDKPLRRFIVEKLPTDYLASFLRGWFDGDGGVVKRKDTGEFWLHFTTGIRENAEALKHSLWRLGITSRVRKRSYYYQVIVYGRSNIKNSLKKIGTNIPQKELKMEEAINIREYEDRIPGVGRLIRRERKKLGISIEKMSSIAPHSSLSEYERGKAIPRSILKKLIQFFEKEGATCHHLKRLVNSNLKWEKIKRKIPSETEDWVYDLTVTSGYEPNFIAEHFILHNCICYFGGDPSPQMPHALRTSEIALEKAREQGRILRICFETNGYMIGAFADRAAELSFESGGTVKFDIKTFNETLNQVLCGVSNKPTLDGFRRIGEKFFRDRLEPPVLTASTLLIPGYINAEEIGQIADFLAGIDPKIPYTLLAFYPQYVMHDLPPTSRQLALECFEAAKKAGLERIKLGNVHLLS